MTVKEQVAVAEELERYLGDPHDPASPMSFTKVLDHDEREEFPHELVGLLQRWNLHEYCLPSAFGGRAGDVEVGFNLLRLVARRDPTTATALMLTNLAFMPAWIAGTDEQKRYFVEAIKRGTRMAWGLSERDHGSDVLSNEMRAERVEGGYLLTGEKWLIGNATVADVVSVQARTNERGGPGDWSIFAVEKRHCPAGSVVHLPNERIHGLRALDMSGIRLDRLFVPESALLGREGQGLELALKSGQVARTTINGMGLGAVDTALRVTMDFVTERVIFGQRVIDVPYTRRQLAESFADLVVADAATTGAVRGLQANPGQASVYSSVVKYHVPTSLERTLAQLSVVLGARLYLRAHPHYGVYQKMLRDALVAIFADGNTVVNLKNIALQLDGLLRTAAGPVTPEAEARVQAQYDLDAPLPEWRPCDQQLFSRGGDDTVLLLPDGVRRLRAMAAAHADERQRRWLSRAADVAASLVVELGRLREEVTRLREAHGKGYAGTAELFRLAEQYCAIHAAAAAVHLFTRSQDALAEPFPDGALLLMCLERATRHFHPARPVTDQEMVDRVVEILRGLHSDRSLFSFWRFQLSASGERR
ncbi:acyl-CoA dehydrogenase [Sphaerisporangium siamense]|uniref:Alkylation response protein AidB-like acyl-CoA dehydrogenase n=1 Tax=Sphaerisporangium siamense TaxID=795645 RepID=A0A7W7D531_9ACTN|nr:acyl-CoA dehydrogenase family protein [Sphaerisporangium siamense]MBB4699108.1 alkylation response protein AidB-like acyl-CoA dehydrogenase [Sphaerisporangium siamense]GII86765.1 acyl-CoA dehydrogenase [Sphaerisporangium siamense]